MVPLYSSDNYYYFIPHKNTEALRASEVHLSYRVSLSFSFTHSPLLISFTFSSIPVAPWLHIHLTSPTSLSLFVFIRILYTRAIYSVASECQSFAPWLVDRLRRGKQYFIVITTVPSSRAIHCHYTVNLNPLPPTPINALQPLCFVLTRWFYMPYPPSPYHPHNNNDGAHVYAPCLYIYILVRFINIKTISYCTLHVSIDYYVCLLYRFLPSVYGCMSMTRLLATSGILSVHKQSAIPQWSAVYYTLIRSQPKSSVRV